MWILFFLIFLRKKNLFWFELEVVDFKSRNCLYGWFDEFVFNVYVN